MTKKELGQILAEETLRISKMEMEANNTREIDKKLWAFFHLGFIANMRLNGATEEDISEVIEKAQEVLLSNEEDTNSQCCDAQVVSGRCMDCKDNVE